MIFVEAASETTGALSGTMLQLLPCLHRSAEALRFMPLDVDLEPRTAADAVVLFEEVVEVVLWVVIWLCPECRPELTEMLELVRLAASEGDATSAKAATAVRMNRLRTVYTSGSRDLRVVKSALST